MIDVRNITVAKAGLRDLSVTIPAGQITALIGPNGAGKTTLLKSIAGLIPVDSGRVEVCGRQLSDYQSVEIAKTICWVPERIHVPFPTSVEHFLMNMRFPWHQGIPSKSDHDSVAKTLREFQLNDYRGRLTHTLSAGEWQRVQLARAFSSPCPILLIDEPDAHLDVGGQADLLTMFGSMVGKTILVVSHNLDLVRKAAQHAIAIKEGGLFAAGHPQDLCDGASLAELFQVASLAEETAPN